ncbi:MAG: MmcQ/YjbR family DNA-binding protein [Dehalococcoidia bacterium]
MASVTGDSGSLVAKVRELCMALPATTEKLSHGEPTWFVGGKTFATVDNNHHNSGHIAWIKGAPGAQETLVAAATERFFRPPYVGHRGWVGARLDDRTVDWDEIAGLLEEAWQMTAPKKVLAAWMAERPAE